MKDPVRPRGGRLRSRHLPPIKGEGARLRKRLEIVADGFFLVRPFR
jgi:hypothetical protein